MIITRIKASNLLKYAKLDLNLPETGLIAISGQNESGKSSIGEAVCFALFGRTFSITPDERHKVVRWGQNHCAVTLSFKVEDTAYELVRFLDQEGNHSAKLSYAGSEDPFVRGVNAVDEALVDMLGFEYEQFVESFYLAQREITTPHPHSQAVKIMAGVASLEEVERELKFEIEDRNELLDEIQLEVETINDEIAALGVEPGLLAQLERDRLETIDNADQVRNLSEQMDRGLEAYCNNSKAIFRADSSRGRATFFRFIFFIVAVLAGALWGLLEKGSGLPIYAQVLPLLDQYVPQYQQVPVAWFGLGGAAAFALFLLLWMRVGVQRKRALALREESGRLAETLLQAREIEIEFNADTPPSPQLAASDADDFEDLDVESLPDRPAREQLEKMLNSISSADAGTRSVREYTEAESAWMRYVAELLVAEVCSLEDAISEETVRADEAEKLDEVRKGVLDRRDDMASRIALRRKALELLTGAITHLSNNFNRDIKNLVARMLPLFTDGRYEHLQINEDLGVRVFSAEKRDFMDLEEVSSGTQRQIMLALRLALSQKLLSRTVSGEQFAFLDEPFAFFDEDRTQSALAALAKLGSPISQVWIVAQSFPEQSAVHYDASIACERGQDVLTLGHPAADVAADVVEMASDRDGEPLPERLSRAFDHE